MKPKNMVEVTHKFLESYLNKNVIAVDMTLGNGNDTLFLAKHVKHVYAYEVQELGISNTQKLLLEHKINNVTIFHSSHENIAKLNVDYQIVIYNLGYLPGSDKTITTTVNSTVESLKFVLNKESVEVVAVVVYPGHLEGENESNALSLLISTIDKKFRVTKVQVLNTHKPAPYLILIEKK